MAQVAAHANVSVPTVSRVMNGTARVALDKRQRVEQAIRALQYRPNQAARSLVRRRSDSMSVIIPFVATESASHRLRGLISVCRGLDFAFHIHDVETAEDLGRHLAIVTSEPHPAALIVMSLSFDGRRLGPLVEAGVPVVAVDSSLQADLTIKVDDVSGGELAVAHLIELGHRRIGFVGEIPEPGLGLVAAENRLKGYRRALAAAGMEVDEALIERIRPDDDVASSLLDRPDPPTAIFAVSDVLALTVMNAAVHRNISIPQDLSVVGFDNIDAARLVGLTTVDQHLVDSGHRAGDFILGKGSGSSRSLELLRRRTTATPRKKEET